MAGSEKIVRPGRMAGSEVRKMACGYYGEKKIEEKNFVLEKL